jgi:hypothetical protein
MCGEKIWELFNFERGGMFNNHDEFKGKGKGLPRTGHEGPEGE